MVSVPYYCRIAFLPYDPVLSAGHLLVVPVLFERHANFVLYLYHCSGSFHCLDSDSIAAVVLTISCFFGTKLFFNERLNILVL
jgi:hypothetical protein